MERLSVGDVIYRSKLPVQHVGIYYGNGLVAHNIPGENAHISSLSEFADGKPLKVKQMHIPIDERDELIKKIDQAINNASSYGVLSNNCEHFLSDCFSRKSKSPQLQKVMIGGGIGFVVSLLADKTRVGKIFTQTILGAVSGLFISNLTKKYDFTLEPETLYKGISHHMDVDNG